MNVWVERTKAEMQEGHAGEEAGAGQACGSDPARPFDMEADQCLRFHDMAYAFKYLYRIFYKYPSMLACFCKK